MGTYYESPYFDAAVAYQNIEIHTSILKAPKIPRSHNALTYPIHNILAPTGHL